MNEEQKTEEELIRILIKELRKMIDEKKARITEAEGMLQKIIVANNDQITEAEARIKELEEEGAMIKPVWTGAGNEQ